MGCDQEKFLLDKSGLVATWFTVVIQKVLCCTTAPVLKGRKRKKKTAVKLVESEDSNESETSSERNSLALDSVCTTPSKAFVSVSQGLYILDQLILAA